MGSPLFTGVVEDKEGPVVSIRLELCDHENYNQFGTDRVFAWSLLAFWLGLDEGAKLRAGAARHVRRVDCILVAGKRHAQGPNWETALPARGEPDPAMSYEIEVYDESLIAPMSIGEEAELAMYVHEGVALENDISERPVPAPAPEAPWHELRHDDGREWAIRVSDKGYEIRLRPSPEEPPIIRKRTSDAPSEEVERLVREQLTEGYVVTARQRSTSVPKVL